MGQPRVQNKWGNRAGQPRAGQPLALPLDDDRRIEALLLQINRIAVLATQKEDDAL